jgi:tetratricopeptide (TPR) repeat protein
MAGVGEPRWHGPLAGALLFALPWLVYLPLRSAGFVWDDDAYVTHNANLHSLAGLARIWLDPTATPQYYPLVHTGFWLEFRLWGLDPLGYHATNVLLHAASALLLWRILLRLGVPGAALAAALFAVHPVMVESVAWITERKNVLSLALSLAALASYLRFAPLDLPAPGAPAQPRRWRFHALALLLFAAALLAKTIVCSLPAVVLLLVWWKRGRIRARDAAPLAPFFAFGLAAGLATAWLEKHHVGAAGTEWSQTPFERLLIAGRALWFYAGKLVWPDPLIFFYPRWQIDPSRWEQAVYPLAALAAFAALWAVRGRIGRGPFASAAIFGGVLVPALGFFDVYPFRYAFVADHFQYHASPALIALFAAALARARERRGAGGRVPAAVAALAIVAALGVRAHAQSRIYADLETLYRDTIAKNPSAWQAHLNLANHLSAAGRPDEAVRFAREAARLAPQLADAHNTLGGVLVLSSPAGPGAARLEEAVDAFERALALEPEHAEALHNLAFALALAGRHAEAARAYARILEDEPAAPDALTGLGRALLTLGRAPEAEAPLREVVRLEPANAGARNDLGVALVKLGRIEEATREFAEAARLAPDFAEARANLERMRSRAGATPPRDGGL